MFSVSERKNRRAFRKVLRKFTALFIFRGDYYQRLTSMGLRSMLRGEAAMRLRDLTVVNRVISFFNRSKKIGKQLFNSDPRLSPKLQII